jgi:predicted DNA-binding ribbon-helix-helix protein
MKGHEEAMTRLSKRSLLLAGHATSVALEPEFWAVLEEMATARGESLAGLITRLDEGRGRGRGDQSGDTRHP